jgi:hypothetical protein
MITFRQESLALSNIVINRTCKYLKPSIGTLNKTTKDIVVSISGLIKD